MSATQERLTGWGRTAATRATVIRPVDAAAGESALRSELPGRAVAFRGLGRSYGDAAQSAGGTVLETTRMARVVAFDRAAGIVRAEAGLSIDALLRETVLTGWFVPVTPGTRMVTLGRAVAARGRAREEPLPRWEFRRTRPCDPARRPRRNGGGNRPG